MYTVTNEKLKVHAVKLYSDYKLIQMLTYPRANGESPGQGLLISLLISEVQSRSSC